LKMAYTSFHHRGATEHLLVRKNEAVSCFANFPPCQGARERGLEKEVEMRVGFCFLCTG